jgi:hypothetical protein
MILRSDEPLLLRITRLKVRYFPDYPLKDCILACFLRGLQRANTGWVASRQKD